MPRVLRIINRLNLGGPTYNVAYLSKYLAPTFETKLVAGVPQSTEASSNYIIKKLGIEPIRIPEMQRPIKPIKDWKSFNKLKKVIKDFKPDIVHTHAAKAGALGRIAAINCGTPVILHTFHGHVFHGYFNWLKTQTFIQIERYLAKQSQAIIALSKQQKEELAHHYQICPATKIKIIPLGFDLKKFNEHQDQKRRLFRQKFKLEEEEVAIGIIGRLVPIKNHLFFLKALKRVLLNTSFKVRAFIIGDGKSKRKIKEQAEAMEIPFTDLLVDNSSPKAPLTFTSWIKAIDEVMAGLDIVTLTSLNEGTPVSLIEAQAAGRPVVSTDVGGVRDVVCAGNSALLCETGQIHHFSQHLIKLIEDPDLRKEMGQQGKAFAHKNFPYQRLTKDMSELYQKLLGKTYPSQLAYS